jgi:hypothetical protein
VIGWKTKSAYNQATMTRAAGGRHQFSGRPPKDVDAELAESDCPRTRLSIDRGMLTTRFHFSEDAPSETMIREFVDAIYRLMNGRPSDRGGRK